MLSLLIYMKEMQGAKSFLGSLAVPDTIIQMVIFKIQPNLQAYCLGN